MKSMRIRLLAASLLATAALAAPAAAQVLPNRTWVSRTGNNANDCLIATPCASFAVAVSKTNAGGLVSCLDSGEFGGGFSLAKSITIRCTGVMASIVVSVGQAMTLSLAGTDKVVLDGLDFEGLGTATGAINVNGPATGAKIHVLNTTIRNFADAGINVQGNNNHLFLDNSFLIGNVTGVRVGGSGNIASLTNSSVRASPTASLSAITSTSIIGVQNSVINDSPVAINRNIGAQVISVGPSNLITGAGSFTSVIPFE